MLVKDGLGMSLDVALGEDDVVSFSGALGVLFT